MVLEPQIDTKDAEKAYLRRAGTGLWERIKPFSPPGADTLRESLRLIHDFAVAVNALDASTTHRVLDLGAGSGWTSEWLRRLNVRLVSLDISLDMLKVAKARPGGDDSSLVAADLEALPFAPGSFDRALCMNALHHVPNPVAALREVHRVLNEDGRLVLLEPGSGHASNAIAQAAMQDFGVLEQELEAPALMQFCSDAGFPHVTVRPLSYMSGEMALTRDELDRWRTWTGTRRPLRAVHKIRRALLEMAGLRKDGLLLEDAVSMTTSRIVMRHLQEQSVVVASKTAAPAIRERRAAVEMLAPGLERRGEHLVAKVRVGNIGTTHWPAAHPRSPVRLGVQLLDGARRLVDRDYARIPLAEDVPVGGSSIVAVEIQSPREAGAHHLKFDLVEEGVAWFEQDGSTALIVPVPTAVPS